MSIFLILLAAGESKRLKSIEPKPYISVNNKTLIEHTIAKVRKIKIIKKIVLTYNKKHKKKLDSLNIKNIIKFKINSAEFVTKSKTKKLGTSGQRIFYLILINLSVCCILFVGGLY